MKYQSPINMFIPASELETIAISNNDQIILRDLAKQVAELATRPIEKEKQKLWRMHNDLEPTRPLVFCDPENGWFEIITPDQIKCS